MPLCAGGMTVFTGYTLHRGGRLDSFYIFISYGRESNVDVCPVRAPLGTRHVLFMALGELGKGNHLEDTMPTFRVSVSSKNI